MSEFPSEIVDLDVIEEHPNILLFSKPGTGKTTWACSDDKILVLNCEDSGVISAKRSKSLGNHVKQWKIKTFDDFIKAVDWLKTYAEEKGSLPFNWVVVDTISTLQDRQLMRYIMDKMLEKKPSRNAYIPDKPEYLENQLTLVQKIKELNDLPVGVIHLAHVMQQADPEGNEFYYPQIQGGKYKVAQQILAMMTSFGYMYVKTRTKDGKPVVQNGKVVKDRYIMWEDHKQIQGKDRTGVLGQFTKNMTLKELRLKMQARDKEIQENADH